jgi:hypothetical protein
VTTAITRPTPGRDDTDEAVKSKPNLNCAGFWLRGSIEAVVRRGGTSPYNPPYNEPFDW